MAIWLYPTVVLAGFACGFINVLAGSGSLITLPLLIFLGLPANVANGTNRVAIFLQNVVGVANYQREKVLDWQKGKWLLIPAVLGALTGAKVAVDLDERLMRVVIGSIMLLMLVVLLTKPNRWLNAQTQKVTQRLTLPETLAFFAVGFYGGFIQAGVGIFLLVALVMASGMDLLKANALKLVIVLGFTLFALIVFMAHDLVHWPIGLLLASGNMLGAWVGTKVAIKKGNRFLHWFLIVVVACSAFKLFWDVWRSAS